MDHRSLEKLESSVERLLDAYAAMKAENGDLRQRLAAMEAKQALFRDRLDAIIERLEGIAVS